MAIEVAGYRLRGRLAQGRTSTLYRAEAIGHPGRLLVVKHLAIGNDTTLLADTVRAAEHRRGVDHPHLLPLLDIVPTSTGLALVLPYAGGGSLADAITRTPAGLPPGTMANIGARIAAALAALHAHGFVHGAITSGGILFDAEGRPLLAGFGCQLRSRPRAAEPGPAETRTAAPAPAETRATTGWAHSHDPSLAASEAPDVASDLHDLGAALYEGLSGQRTSTAGTTSDDALTATCHGRRRPLTDLVDAPRSLTGAIESAMALGVDDRPATAAQLADLLTEVSQDVTSMDTHGTAATGQRTTPVAHSAAATGQRTTPVAHNPPGRSAGGRELGRTATGPPPSGRSTKRWLPRALALVAAAVIVFIPVLVIALSSSAPETRITRTTPAPPPTAANDATPRAPSGRSQRADQPAADLVPPPRPPQPPPACDDLDPPGGMGELLLADLDGRGCPTPVRWDGTELTVPMTGDDVRRFTLDADPDDQLLFADLACQGRDAPVLYRPGSGEVFAFDGLVAPGEEVAAIGQPSGAIGGHATVVQGDDGCDRIQIIDPR